MRVPRRVDRGAEDNHHSGVDPEAHGRSAGGLGILDADDVPAGTTSVKLLRIDGTAPGDDGYPLVR
jgi:hypothetical protein